MSLNLAVLLTESTKTYPNDVALIFDTVKLTYAQLNAVSSQFAHALKQAGLKRGDKVGLMLPNIPQFVIAYYGILKAGGVVVPMNVLLKGEEIEYVLKDSDAVALVSWEGFAAEAVAGFNRASGCQTLIIAQVPGSSGALPEVSHGQALGFNAFMKDASPTFDLDATMPDDTAVILYTSGTTGKPKGAELTHFNMFYNAQVAGTLVQLQRGDVGIGILPMFHAFGQSSVLNTCIGKGLTVSLVARFDPVKVLEIIQRDRVSIISGVPTMFFALLHAPERKDYDTSSLRIATSGGSAMPVEVLHAFEQEFGIPILEGYGLSETSPTASFNLIDRPRKPGSIGMPVWGVDMKVVDDNDQAVKQGEIGEIVIRGHNVMKGYYKRPDATAEAMRNDWFHTGDVAYIDEEGYFFIVDRKKDMIIRGGFNVYPREIEEVLYQHSAVREAAVVGVPDPKMGEDVKAFVSLKPAATATPDELIEFCKGKLAAYKYPRTIEILPDLPKGPTGKLLKRELRNLPQEAKTS